MLIMYGVLRYIADTYFPVGDCGAAERYETKEAALEAAFNALDFRSRPEWCNLCCHWHCSRVSDCLDMEDLLQRQKRWSAATFGSGLRTVGNTAHIEKEIAEVRENPTSTEEWIDIVLLGIDGYWRAGGRQIFKDLVKKQNRNMRRKYLRTPEDTPSEHDRSVPEE